MKAEGIQIGAVDSTVEKDLGERFEVKGFPTLKVFIKGKPSDYNGGRTADAIISYLKMTKGNKVSTVEDVEKLTASKHTFLLVSDNETLNDKLREVALSNSELANFAVVPAANASIVNAKQGDLVFLKKGDKASDATVSKASVDENTLSKAVDDQIESMIPLVGEVSEEN